MKKIVFIVLFSVLYIYSFAQKIDSVGVSECYSSQTLTSKEYFSAFYSDHTIFIQIYTNICSDSIASIKTYLSSDSIYISVPNCDIAPNCFRYIQFEIDECFENTYNIDIQTNTNHAHYIISEQNNSISSNGVTNSITYFGNTDITNEDLQLLYFSGQLYVRVNSAYCDVNSRVTLDRFTNDSVILNLKNEICEPNTELVYNKQTDLELALGQYKNFILTINRGNTKIDTLISIDEISKPFKPEIKEIQDSKTVGYEIPIIYNTQLTNNGIINWWITYENRIVNSGKKQINTDANNTDSILFTPEFNGEYTVHISHTLGNTTSDVDSITFFANCMYPLNNESYNIVVDNNYEYILLQGENGSIWNSFLGTDTASVIKIPISNQENFIVTHTPYFGKTCSTSTNYNIRVVDSLITDSIYDNEYVYVTVGDSISQLLSYTTNNDDPAWDEVYTVPASTDLGTANIVSSSTTDSIMYRLDFYAITQGVTTYYGDNSKNEQVKFNYYITDSEVPLEIDCPIASIKMDDVYYKCSSSTNIYSYDLHPELHYYNWLPDYEPIDTLFDGQQLIYKNIDDVYNVEIQFVYANGCKITEDKSYEIKTDNLNGVSVINLQENIPVGKPFYLQIKNSNYLQELQDEDFNFLCYSPSYAYTIIPKDETPLTYYAIQTGLESGCKDTTTIYFTPKYCPEGIINFKDTIYICDASEISITENDISMFVDMKSNVNNLQPLSITYNNLESFEFIQAKKYNMDIEITYDYGCKLYIDSSLYIFSAVSPPAPELENIPTVFSTFEKYTIEYKQGNDITSFYNAEVESPGELIMYNDSVVYYSEEPTSFSVYLETTDATTGCYSTNSFTFHSIHCPRGTITLKEDSITICNTDFFPNNYLNINIDYSFNPQQIDPIDTSHVSLTPLNPGIISYITTCNYINGCSLIDTNNIKLVVYPETTQPEYTEFLYDVNDVQFLTQEITSARIDWKSPEALTYNLSGDTIYVNYNTIGKYIFNVKAIDSLTGCESKPGINKLILVDESMCSISGEIVNYATTGEVLIQLYKQSGNGYIPVANTFAEANGEFKFMYLQQGNYIIEANATNNLYYPTYFASKKEWQKAASISLVGYITGMQIELEKKPTNNPIQNGIIQGSVNTNVMTQNVTESWNFQSKMLYNVLLKQNGIIVGSTLIDENGTFNFSNLANGEYEVITNVPGTKTKCKTVTISNSNTVSIDLQLETDLTNIHEAVENSVRVYPTLAQNNLYIQSAQQFSHYKIINELGNIVQSGIFVNKISVAELPTGTYFMLLYNGAYTTQVCFIKQ